MGTVIAIGAARPETATPPRHCKGPACPAFAMCQGRCAERPVPRLMPDDEGRRLGLER